MVKYEDPRGFDPAIAELIFNHMPDQGRAGAGQIRPGISHTKLRLRVMVLTGWHQIELMRFKPEDFRELRKRRVWVTGRKKGKGTAPGWHPVTRAARQAIRAALAADVLGKPFSVRAMATSWNIAVQHAKAAWQAATPKKPWPLPDNIRPYDLRHTYGTAVYRTTGDIRAAQKLLRNKTISVTMRYTLAAVDDLAQAASNALDAAQGAAKTFTSLSRTGVKKGQKATPMTFRGHEPKQGRAGRKLGKVAKNR